MCSGGWNLGANGISRKGGRTDLERSSPGLSEREKYGHEVTILGCKK